MGSLFLKNFGKGLQETIALNLLGKLGFHDKFLQRKLGLSEPFVDSSLEPKAELRIGIIKPKGRTKVLYKSRGVPPWRPKVTSGKVVQGAVGKGCLSKLRKKECLSP